MPNLESFVCSVFAAFPLIKPAGGIPVTTSNPPIRECECVCHNKQVMFSTTFHEPTLPRLSSDTDSNLRPMHAAREQNSKRRDYPMPQRTF